MGEYARIQMAEDARRMFGGDWEPEDFEPEPVKAKRPVCPKCGKKFRVHLAVRDHMRDKHAAPAPAPAKEQP
jgi:hypothetical protein